MFQALIIHLLPVSNQEPILYFSKADIHPSRVDIRPNSSRADTRPNSSRADIRPSRVDTWEALHLAILLSRLPILVLH